MPEQLTSDHRYEEDYADAQPLGLCRICGKPNDENQNSAQRSSNLVVKLRELADIEAPRLESEVIEAWHLLSDAADEIERLTALLDFKNREPPHCPSCSCGMAASETTGDRMKVTDEMVTRFLGWKLPKDFMPDGGVTFTPINHPTSWPIGTNLLTAVQARVMLEHVLAENGDAK